MISRLISMAAGAFLGLATTATAITITPGNTYQGTVSFGPDNLQAASCCPVIPGTVTFNGLQQYYINTGPMAVGTTFTASLLDLSGSLLSQVTWGPQGSAHNGGLGLGVSVINPAAALPASGLLQITASGAAIDINSFDLAANFNATVQHPTLGPLATTLQSRNPVTNLALLQTTPPGGGGLTPVPLPAPVLLMLAGLAALWRVARGPKRALTA